MTEYPLSEQSSKSYSPTARAASSVIPLVAWLALGSACLGWMFDSMDLNLFTLILFPTVSDLIGSSNSASVAAIGGTVVAIKLFAWGLGGILFGVVADRIGRSRTMIITILIYAIFTGLSGLSRNWMSSRSCKRSPASASAASGRQARRSLPRHGQRTAAPRRNRSCR
jgi:MFS family permease